MNVTVQEYIRRLPLSQKEVVFDIVRRSELVGIRRCNQLHKDLTKMYKTIREVGTEESDLREGRGCLPMYLLNAEQLEERTEQLEILEGELNRLRYVLEGKMAALQECMPKLRKATQVRLALQRDIQRCYDEKVVLGNTLTTGETARMDRFASQMEYVLSVPPALPSFTLLRVDLDPERVIAELWENSSLSLLQ